MNKIKNKLIVLLITIMSTILLFFSKSALINPLHQDMVYAKTVKVTKHKIAVKTKTHSLKHKNNNQKIADVKYQHSYTNNDIPVIDSFTNDICVKYYLSGDRWRDKIITYDDSQMSAKYRKIAERVINRINQLYIVTLIPTKDRPDIKIITAHINENTGWGVDPHYAGLERSATPEQLPTYKNMHAMAYALLILDPRKLDNKQCFNHAFERLCLHEIGHALGLAHVPHTDHKYIMSPNLAVNDNTPGFPDQEFIDSLAVLYNN